PQQVIRLKRRHRDTLRLKLGEEVPEPLQVGLVDEQGQVDVAAKLRCAVQHAGLAAHEQALDPVRPDQRKGSAYRVLAQAFLRSQGSASRASATLSTAAAASTQTTRAIPVR